MFKTVAIKQWPEISGRIWTYPVVALTLTLFMQETNPFILAVIGVFLALDMAVQLGGDDVRWNAFEFIFTRAIDRRKYLTTRFLFGLIPLVGLALLYVVFEFADLKALYWNIISEPVGPGKIDPIPLGEEARFGYFTVLAFVVLLIYTTVFFFCSTTRKESAFGGFLVLGFVGTLVYTVIVTYVLETFLFAEAEGLNDLFASMPYVSLIALLLALPAALLFFFSREHYARCELPAVSRADRGSSSTGLWLILIVVIIIVLALLLTMTAPQPSPGG